MAFSDEMAVPETRCEICGSALSDEVIIQEFADGSIARLCPECAAGAVLPPDSGEFRFPDDLPPDKNNGDSGVSMESPAAEQAATREVPETLALNREALGTMALDQEALEKTRELLTPVVDLITLQREMQGALQRLATSLQTFASGVISEKMEKSTTVEERLEALERELEATRTRLRETEALLAARAAAPPAAAPVTPAEPARAAAPPAAASVTPTPAPALAAEQAAEQGTLPAVPASVWDFEETAEATAETVLGDTGEYLSPQPAGSGAAVQAQPAGTATQPYSLSDLESTLPPVAPPLVPPPVAPPAGPPTAEPHTRPGFQLSEVQIAQRYFNESQFTNRVRDVRKSLGRPRANLTKLIGNEPQALLTIAWDIIWYQYLINLRRDAGTDQRVTMHKEGMDLDELAAGFREKNASVDDEGRLDASELEVKLLSDPSTLITEMSVDEERALEDATEEIWDQKTAPEFKWDD